MSDQYAKYQLPKNKVVVVSSMLSMTCGVMVRV